MIERANDPIRSEPVIDRPERLGGAARLIILACGLIGAALGFAVLGRERAEPLVLGLLGILSVIGIFTLFAGAIGLIRFAGRTQGNPLAKAFLDSMTGGVMMADREGRIVYANRAYADLIGADAESDVRAVDRVFAGEAAASEAVYRLAQAVREGREAVEEVRMPAPLAVVPDGEATPRWYRVRVRPVPVRSEHRTLSVWQVEDVTEERAGQESTFQDLQHVIDYLDHAPAGFLSAEPDGRVVYMNATLADWLGIDLASFAPGKLGLDQIVGGDGAALLAAMARPGRSPERTEIIDIDMIRRNGQSLPVRLLHRVPIDRDGAPGATRTLVLNRSPGEDASETVRAAEVRFTRFFNNTPIAIASLDRSGGVSRSNAPFLRLFGPDDDGPRRKLVDLVGATERAGLQAAIDEAASGRGSIPAVDASLASDPQRSARFFVSAIAEGGDADETVIVYALEMTEQRTLETQLRQQQKMESVGQLAGGVAHDFNNVLTAIIGFSDLLLTNHRPSDPSFQDIMNIKQNANRAASLVRQLLAFSRQQTLRPQVLSLADLVTDLSILLERLLGEKVQLKLQLGRDLWPIRADLNQLEQVIINLAVNARDAMPDGGTLTIRTRNVAPGDVAGYGYNPLPEAEYALIEVEDTGTGMPPEVQAKIFEPFYSTKEVGKGTGLGLSTVYGIVKQTGGHVYFDSEVGRGTVFRIFIPRNESPVEAVVETAPEQTVEISDLTGSANILLVEDEEAVRAFAARALAQRGYEVHQASSGVEALEVMKELDGRVDLVVSDVVMPELDGPSLLRELRKERPDLKIIFISGYAEDAFKKNLPEGESFQFLPKPFSLKQLATAVKETLGR